VPIVLKSFDLFYFPSITEGQPNALIEAMISGLPILASNIFPIIEALPESAHSLMFDPLNVDDVTTTILHLSKKNDDLKKYIFKDWARLEFDHIKNFALFENQISNEK
jgi:glycosyltransferase involved in cell wall biosynthesis